MPTPGKRRMSVFRVRQPGSAVKFTYSTAKISATLYLSVHGVTDAAGSGAPHLWLMGKRAGKSSRGGTKRKSAGAAACRHTSARRERRRKKTRAHDAHESAERLSRRKFELKIKTLECRVARERERLKSWGPSSTAPIVAKSGVDRRLPKGALRGAALPADAHEYTAPVPEETTDLLADHAGRCCERPETWKLCASLLELGFLLYLRGSSVEAAERLRELVGLDHRDPLCGRAMLVRVLFEDAEDLSETRSVIEAAVAGGGEEVASELLWSRALLEFVAWRLLGESTDDGAAAAAALRTASQANPFISSLLRARGVFTEIVDPGVVDEITADSRDRVLRLLSAQPPSELSVAQRAGECSGGGAARGSRAEAVAYVAAMLGTWVDAGDACEWAARECGGKDLTNHSSSQQGDAALERLFYKVQHAGRLESESD